MKRVLIARMEGDRVLEIVEPGSDGHVDDTRTGGALEWIDAPDDVTWDWVMIDGALSVPPGPPADVVERDEALNLQHHALNELLELLVDDPRYVNAVAMSAYRRHPGRAALRLAAIPVTP